jgi:hypothetical protein
VWTSWPTALCLRQLPRPQHGCVALLIGTVHVPVMPALKKKVCNFAGGVARRSCGLDLAPCIGKKEQGGNGHVREPGPEATGVRYSGAYGMPLSSASALPPHICPPCVDMVCPSAGEEALRAHPCRPLERTRGRRESAITGVLSLRSYGRPPVEVMAEVHALLEAAIAGTSQSWQCTVQAAHGSEDSQERCDRDNAAGCLLRSAKCLQRTEVTHEMVV